MVQGDELEVPWVPSHVLEGTLNAVQVVSPNRSVFTSSAEGVVEFFLGSDEGLVGLFVEANVAEDGGCDEGADLLDLRLL